jgi:hypothetical protein
MTDKSAQNWLFEPQDWMDKNTRADAITSLIVQEIAAQTIKIEDERREEARKSIVWGITTAISTALGILGLLKYAGIV